ncbi:MAG: HlyD family efflux transporter periplasmic adaptor subunit [Alphaproteobacteria bacterium]
MVSVPNNADTATPPPGQQGVMPATPVLKQQVRNTVNEREAYLSLLLRIELRAREAVSAQELAYIIVNDTKKIAASQQIFLFELADGSIRPRAVSDVAVLDPNTPFMQWIGRIAGKLAKDADIAKPQQFSLPAYCDVGDEEVNTYPFTHFLWAPLSTREGTVFAGLLQARQTPWAENDISLTAHLAGVYQHAWLALKGPSAIKRPKRKKRLAMLGAAALLAAVSWIPVPLTALAPAEVVARNPFVIAAPLDGVIDTIVAEPNAPVRKGEPILRFVDTVFRNKYEAAEQSVVVANAKYRRLQQAAITDSKARHEMAIARAELGLALSERNFAKAILTKTVVKAPASGIVILANKDYWKGRPVSTGEQILQIARPDEVELRVDLSVRDAIVLREGAHLDVYLDAAPLSKIKASLTHASYQAEPTETQTLVYRVRARFSENPSTPLKIGARGVAQIYGDTVPLIFYLLRRPLSVIRQSIGL